MSLHAQKHAIERYEASVKATGGQVHWARAAISLLQRGNSVPCAYARVLGLVVIDKTGERPLWPTRP